MCIIFGKKGSIRMYLLKVNLARTSEYMPRSLSQISQNCFQRSLTPKIRLNVLTTKIPVNIATSVICVAEIRDWCRRINKKQMVSIAVSESFKEICPSFCGAAIHATVKNSALSESLWDEIIAYSNELSEKYTTDTIKERAGIQATRLAYKAFGKDPSRYRPACEQLARRILQGKDLYHINTVVDVVNLLSLYTGYSTAALDEACIIGNNVELGIGWSNEPYQAIGRGVLNIENLPVYRDAEGAFATPTSDSTRTMVSLDTTNLLVLINAYDGDHQHLHEAIKYGVRCLEQYACASNIEVTVYASHITPQIEALQQECDCF